MLTVTINIVERDTPTLDTPSVVGHMWYSLRIKAANQRGQHRI